MDHPPAPFFFSVNFPLVSGDREIGRAAGGSAAELRIKRVLSTADGTLHNDGPYASFILIVRPR